MILAYINFLILLVVTVFHVYWGLGGNWGVRSVLPEQNGTSVMPFGRGITLIVALIFGGMAFFYLYKIGQFPSLDSIVPNWLSQYGLWLLAGIFSLRAIGDFRYVGFFKQVRNSRFAKLDTKFYSPLCLLLSVNTFLLISFLSKS